MRTTVNRLTLMTDTPADSAGLDAAVLAVDTREACRLLGISRGYLMRLIYAGEITSVQLPSLRTGKPYAHRFEISELEDFLKRHRRTA
jgi:excisionase family DNA binding protein